MILPESRSPGAPDPYSDAHDEIAALRSDAQEEADKTEAARSFWRELPILVLIALIVAVLIKTFLFQAFWIPSSSMENTLQINDRVMVSKLSFTLGDIERGDVIVFDDPRGREVRNESIVQATLRNIAEAVGLSTPRTEFIKRVIGLPGDVIRVEAGRVVVNGEPLVEPYLHPDTRMPDFGPETVPSGFVFVMGDNRNSSQDSRVFGPIPQDDIVGRAFVILWPPSRWSGL